MRDNDSKSELYIKNFDYLRINVANNIYLILLSKQI